MEKDKKPKPRQLLIDAHKESLKGNYSNNMMVAHTRDEFILDFMFFGPQGTILTSRIVTTPPHVKRMANNLMKNLNAYEERYGKIEISQIPGPPGIVKPPEYEH